MPSLMALQELNGAEILDKTVTSSRRPDDDHEEWKKRDSSTGQSKSKYFNPPEKRPNPRSLHAKEVKKRRGSGSTSYRCTVNVTVEKEGHRNGRCTTPFTD
ncbi:unnamed protein product [Arctogadus glacialis]